MDPEHADEKGCMIEGHGEEVFLFYFGSMNGVLNFEIPPWRFFLNFYLGLHTETAFEKRALDLAAFAFASASISAWEAGHSVWIRRRGIFIDFTMEMLMERSLVYTIRVLYNEYPA